MWAEPVNRWSDYDQKLFMNLNMLTLRTHVEECSHNWNTCTCTDLLKHVYMKGICLHEGDMFT